MSAPSSEPGPMTTAPASDRSVAAPATSVAARAWQAGIGALIGIGLALFGIWIAGPEGRHLPYTIFLVLAIGIVGLAFGALASLAAWIGGSATVIATVLSQPGGVLSLAGSDMIRFGAFLFGSPVLVYLVNRAETAREVAAQALNASRAAEQRLEAERERLATAGVLLESARAGAERERARLEEVAESIPEPLIVYDEQGRGTYGNRAALRLFGRSFVERSVAEWGRSTEPRDEHGRSLDQSEWPQLLAQSEAIKRRLVVRIPMSGRDVIVDVEGTPIPGGGAVLLLRDVGKEEDERRRLSRFASFVAHELRNPLAVAKARTELAQRDPDLSARARGHGMRALESIDAAIGILERLELYSRADAGGVEAARETFELAPAVGSAIERLRTRGSEREVLVELAPGVRIVGDRPLSEQAITNLLTNADRYSTPGAPIRVQVENGDHVTLRVRDEGPGISDEVAARLFHDRVAAGRGLGLGLYLVRASMEAMGGSVTLEQRRPQAVFALRWPAARG